MNEAKALRRELKNTGYEIFIGILSVLSIVNLVLVYAIQDDGTRSHPRPGGRRTADPTWLVHGAGQRVLQHGRRRRRGQHPFDYMELVRRTPQRSVFTYQGMMRFELPTNTCQSCSASTSAAASRATCAAAKENVPPPCSRSKRSRRSPNNEFSAPWPPVRIWRLSWDDTAPPARFERATGGLEVRCSIQAELRGPVPQPKSVPGPRVRHQWLTRGLSSGVGHGSSSPAPR